MSKKNNGTGNPVRSLKEYRESRTALAPRVKYFVMKSRAKKKGFDICSVDEFVAWHKLQKKECAYCEIPQEIWETLYMGHQHKFSLTIDRKDSRIGYLVENMVFACSQCNSGKNDLFSYLEMKEIAEKYLKPKWQRKIMDIKNTEVIYGRR